MNKIIAQKHKRTTRTEKMFESSATETNILFTVILLKTLFDYKISNRNRTHTSHRGE